MVDFKPLDPEQPIAKSRRHLPHWEQAGAAYFVTFRLGDSLAQEVLRNWKDEMAFWKERNPTVAEADKAEYMRKFSEQRHAWLDAGHGSCLLKIAAAAEIVEGAFRHFDGDRYALGEYVIMPNHVHVIVAPMAEWALSTILHSWKSFTSKQINKALGREGNVWQDENWDKMIRGAEQWRFFVHYIRNNPAKAKLKEGEFRLGCGLLKCDV